MMHVQGQRGKAIFVDGQSVHRAKDALGIQFINFKGLYDVLTRHVGACRVLAQSARITIDHTRVQNRHGLAKDMAGAGFELVKVVSADSADDEMLKMQIERLDPRLVSEIVLLSHDRDFVPVLRCKASQGITVHWVGTMRAQLRDGRCGLSEDVIQLFKAGVFSFTELLKYAQRISDGRISTPPSCSGSAGPDDVTEFLLSYKSRRPHDHVKLAGAISRLCADFPGLNIKVTK